jgi:5-methylthioribose kinase
MIDFKRTSLATLLENSTEIGDGNMNYVYKLNDGEKTYAIKHAKPYLKILGEDFQLTQKRVVAEMNSMEYFHSIAPDFVPKIYHKSENEHFFVMEYLDGYSSLRENPQNTKAYEKLGNFLFSLLQNTPQNNTYYECEELKQITKNYVFEFPFIKNHEALVILDFFPWREFSAEFLANKERLKEVFLHSKTSLIHGDLHSDSVMVKEDCIAIIDSEFSLFCEVSFDIGNLLAHVILAQIGHKNTPYQEKIYALLKPFEKDIVQNAIGFCSVEMARRLFVPAKSKDLQNTQAYELAFSIANEIGSLHVKSTEEFLRILERFF